MKFKFCIYFFALVVFSAFGQDNEIIRLKVKVVNAANGSEIKSPQIAVLNQGKLISPKTEKKETFYEITKGSSLKINVTQAQFYPEEKIFDTERLYSGDVLEIKLNPQPTGAATLVIVDQMSNAPIEAQVKVTNGGQTSIQHYKSAPLAFNFVNNGSYQFEVEAEGYEALKQNEILELNTPNKTITLKLKKLSILQEVKVVNKFTGQPLFVSNVQIVNIKNQKDKPVWNGEKSNFEGFANEYYTIKVTAEGFKPFENTYKPSSNAITLALEPKPLAPFVIQIADANVGTSPILEVTTPLGGKEPIGKNLRYTPKEPGVYEFKLTKAGYGSYSQSLSTEYLENKKETVVNFEIKSELKTIVINVFDSETKKPLNNAVIKAFNNKATEIAGIANKNSKTFKVQADDRLFFEISAEGYEDKTVNLGATGETIVSSDIGMVRKAITNFQEHEYVLVDALTNKPILKSHLVITDPSGKTIETLYNDKKGSYLTYKIDPKAKYHAIAQAEGYKEFNGEINNNDKVVTLKLSPIDKLAGIIIVSDDYTQDPIRPTQVRVLNMQGQPMPLTPNSKGYNFQLNPNENYAIEIEAEGYPKVAHTYENMNLAEQIIKVGIRKKEYPFSVHVENDLTQEQKNLAEAIIRYSDGTLVPNQFNKRNKDFELLSDPNQVMQIEIRIPGFKNYIASNNRKDKKQLALNAVLEPIPNYEEKPTAPIEVVQEKVVSPPTPAQPVEMKLGKKFPLEGVNFEQSSTKMLYGSELKLNELLAFLNEHPQAKIEIVGHTDKIGDERQNLRLSEFRARAVANWLFNKGISPDRISTSGKGSSEPIAANDTEENKAQNRRIEVLVIDEN